MNRAMEMMNRKEFESVFTKDMFNRINKMIEEKLSWGNAILLLKRIGHCKTLLNSVNHGFDFSLLKTRFEKMIYEEKKKERKNERLLVNLYECFLMLYDFGISNELLTACVRSLLKVALCKEDSKEAQKEVEIVLMALNNVNPFGSSMKKEQYLNEMTEIIRYHQEHRNLTRLAYQSAWEFLIDRLTYDGELNSAIVNELHFAKEARKELEDLARSLDGEENERNTKKVFEGNMLRRWIGTVEVLFFNCQLRKEDSIGLMNSVARVFKVAKDNYDEIRLLCFCFFKRAANRNMEYVDMIFNEGIVDQVLGVISQSNVDRSKIEYYLSFLEHLCKMLKVKKEIGKDEKERKRMQRKLFEKMEEEGTEDCLVRFRKL
ncbi:uncharacterized protein MONOS_11800 [Monocercomonoides exilis]|uniref:uncharacterized protein n=1 Tax=Monocercomonoides exilis TaxID=2049356 RepID=UPI003559C746|nr:hypothetical protein MONOS_11800 [Monocercomonoides exilis]|eukprot:MONOS_11800.1-p1 / transcript=MONOS_11800.1 / gene=MONOS_11800 / organism=Monocercomonoides_exilis_PA203 / gene_product=unspecified product / transcript_product=unspecified product / location=Mono_scaffold00612:36090-37301(+) / protein_length=375 / sequence_SO=supercontig / SO=protein_coding / is_pseudo=false